MCGHAAPGHIADALDGDGLAALSALVVGPLCRDAKCQADECAGQRGDERYAGLDHDLEALAAQGYKVTTTPAERTYAEAHPGWLPYRIEVRGADHEGIIHEVAHYLSERGINIESVESETTPAPTSGAPLFNMTAQVVVPPGLSGQGWEAGLEGLGSRLNLEITVDALKDR